MRLMKLGQLDAVVTDAEGGEGADGAPVVVALHGFGAPADDLVPLAGVFRVPSGTRFVFPAARLELPTGFAGGRAWWHIDMAELEEAIESGRERDLTARVPEGMAESRAALDSLLDEVERRFSPSRIVLGGFSQGAMLTVDTALRSQRPLAGLILMSGTLLAEQEWLPLMPRRQGLRVFQSHGTRDPLLPHNLAERLRDHLRVAGSTVEWVSFRGGHEIPGPVIEGINTFLADVLG